MHPTITQQLALQRQSRMLDEATADRLARLATAGRPSSLARLVAALRGMVHARRIRPRPTATSARIGPI